LQNETLEKGRGKFTTFLHYAYSKEGLAMLGGILNSDKAFHVNIAIMGVFVVISDN